MGNGKDESISDINKAWDNAKRNHQETGKIFDIATTSCRVVNFDKLTKEVENSHLMILEKGVTQIVPIFSEIMYVVVKKYELIKLREKKYV